MKKNNSIYILFCVAFLLSACFKEEEKRPANTQSNISIKLGEDYSTQTFFNLAEQKIISQNQWTAWNLAFSAQEDKYYIKLNAASSMRAYATTSQNLNENLVFDNNWEEKIDAPDGNENQIALKFNTQATQNDTIYFQPKIYVLNLGTESTGNELGYKKIQLNYCYNNTYNIAFADLDGSNFHTYDIAQNSDYNFMYFSFENGGKLVDIEPKKNTWDLLITRYTELLSIPNSQDSVIYTVVGVLLNPFSASAYSETNMPYAEISKTNIITEKLSANTNSIGFNWKIYDINAGQYSIIQNKSYIIKDFNDFHYKLKFISFYDPETNVKGTVTFKYEILN